MASPLPTIVILGRPNVGKSTLFNRLTRSMRALVHNIPGVTRDRVEMTAEWILEGKPVSLRIIDTGGLGGNRFDEEIRQQVDIALETAHLGIFVLDAQEGPQVQDQEILREYQKRGLTKKIPLIGVVNKVDFTEHESSVFEFFSLGLDPLLPISAEHARGIETLKETIGTLLKSVILSSVETPPEASYPRIAIVGKPNVGKSTLLNALAKEERVITSPIAGTTVDSVDSIVDLNGKPYIFIDTAGIRKKAKTEKGIEVLSVLQSKKALEKADLAILIIDAEQGPSDQDEKIGGLIQDAGCSAILFVNKWDLQSKKPEFTQKGAAEHIRAEMGFLGYAPLTFGSALNKKGIKDLPELIGDILYQRRLKIPTHEFTEFIRKEATVHNPRNAKFYYAHQTSFNPPSFVCHVNDPKKIHFSLSRHLVNAIRDRWGYMGSPVRLKFIESGKSSRKN